MGNKKKCIVSLLCMLLFSTLTFAQITVKGQVKDTEGYEMPGVNVLVKGSNNGTVTDLDGNYSITVSSDKDEL